MKSAWSLPCAQQTQRLGAALGLGCPWSAREPRLIFLRGELGSGKTTLAAALLQALGVLQPVRSPSYALIETYTVRAGLAVHVDLYRLNAPSELEQLALRDYLSAHTLLLIEWPERAGALLAAPDLDLRLGVVDRGRECRIEARTAAGEAWLAVAEREFPSQM